MNSKEFEPVMAPMMVLSPRLLDEFIRSLRQGVLMVRSVELPVQGMPLKADVTVRCDAGGNRLKVTGTLEIEHFAVKSVGQDFLLCTFDELEQPKEKTPEEHNKEAAESEKFAHRDWWNLSVREAPAKGKDAMSDSVYIKLPPFDTFAFDRVADALKAIGKEIKDYESGVCWLSFKEYRESIFPVLRKAGFTLPRPDGI